MVDPDPELLKRCQWRMYLGMNLSSQAHHCAPITSIVTDPHDRLYTASRDATVKVWSLAGDRLICDATWRGHTDWVTSLTMFGDLVLTGSCDKSIRVWHAPTGTCQTCVRFHRDYIEGIAVADQTGLVVSTGLDNQLFIWDINIMNIPIRDMIKDGDEKCGSIYSVAMDTTGSTIITGSADKVVRLWDHRIGRVTSRLLGHTANIRAVAIAEGAPLCASAGADHTIKQWDIRVLSQGSGTSRCVETVVPIAGSVWTLAHNPSLSTIYAGGRSGQVSCTNRLEKHTLLCATIGDELSTTALHLNKDRLHIATSNNQLVTLNVEALELNRNVSSMEYADSASTFDEVCAIPPCRIVENECARGIPRIVAAHALNDGMRVMVQDSFANIFVYDVVQQRLVHRAEGKATLQDAAAVIDTDVSVPSWFTIDLHLGALGIVLHRSTAFQAEIWRQSEDNNAASVLGMVKINLGSMALTNVLNKWRAHQAPTLPDLSTAATSIDATVRPTNSPAASPKKGRQQWFGFDDHTDWVSKQGKPDDAPLSTDPAEPIFSPKRMLGPSMELESSILNECLVISHQVVDETVVIPRVLNVYQLEEYGNIVPAWVQECVLKGVTHVSKVNEVKFDLVPANNSDEDLKLPSGSSMKAEESVTMRRLAAYIIQSIQDQINPNSEGDVINRYVKGQIDAKCPELAVEILCEQQVLDPFCSLRTVRSRKRMNMKISGLTLQYRRSINSSSC